MSDIYNIVLLFVYSCILTQKHSGTISSFAASFQNRKCGYYKYYGNKVIVGGENTVSIAHSDDDVEDTGINEVRLSTQIDTSEFCYLLSSCSKRVIDNLECTLGRNNFLDVRFFVANVEDCQAFCRKSPGCRYKIISCHIYPAEYILKVFYTSHNQIT